MLSVSDVKKVHGGRSSRRSSKHSARSSLQQAMPLGDDTVSETKDNVCETGYGTWCVHPALWSNPVLQQVECVVHMLTFCVFCVLQHEFRKFPDVLLSWPSFSLVGRISESILEESRTFSGGSTCLQFDPNTFGCLRFAIFVTDLSVCRLCQ